jgi:CBS domain-containing protein/RNA polymerase-binding transcription factor DksA
MLTAAHAMQTKVETVSPTLALVDLERRFLMSGRQGFPVVERGRLVGIVSRSDLVRMLSVTRSAEEQRSDFYRSFEDPSQPGSAAAESAATGAAVGERLAGLSVRDAMIQRVISVDSDLPLTEVARLMLDAHIHRLPVVDKGQLRGIVTTLDIVRLFARGEFAEVQPGDPGGELLLAPGATQGERLEGIRATLEDRRAKLLDRVGSIQKDLRVGHHPDSQERAIERENDEVLERIEESERRHLAQVESALSRIAAGSYDSCERCGNPVGPERQTALPEATRCRACA